MAVDMLIKIGDIVGESKVDGHDGEIDVLSWSWGMTQSGSWSTGGGGGSGKANIQDLSFTKKVDTSTSALMRACATGDPIGKSTLLVRKAGGSGGPLDYIQIDLTDSIVTSVQTGGSGGEEELTENVTLNFAMISFKYQSQSTTGTSAGNFPFEFNITTGKSS